MSDEEEMERIGATLGDTEGLGEVLVDYTEDYRDLGLIE